MLLGSYRSLENPLFRVMAHYHPLSAETVEIRSEADWVRVGLSQRGMYARLSVGHLSRQHARGLAGASGSIPIAGARGLAGSSRIARIQESFFEPVCIRRCFKHSSQPPTRNRGVAAVCR